MPDPQTLAALVSVPSAVAVIVMAGLFLKHIAQQRTEDRIAYAEQRSLDRALIENHLSKSIAAHAQTTTALSELVTSIKVMQTENNGSMQWARDAMQQNREAMQLLIREVGRSSPTKE